MTSLPKRNPAAVTAATTAAPKSASATFRTYVRLHVVDRPTSRSAEFAYDKQQNPTHPTPPLDVPRQSGQPAEQSQLALLSVQQL